MKGMAPQNTTIAIVATDAKLSKSQARRLATMALAGFAKALRPTLAALDGDVVFAAATARSARAADPADEVEIGTLAADCLARGIARAIYLARALPYTNAQPSWHDRFGGKLGDTSI
jgi:L-aminopeptidase/D-esterase-like protein